MQADGEETAYPGQRRWRMNSVALFEDSFLRLASKKSIDQGSGGSRNIGCSFQLAWKEDSMYNVILKRFDQPDEVRTFDKGRFELVHIGGLTIGRAIYEPGWKWSVHVGKTLGKKSCDVEHVGLVISGRATAAMDDGRVIEMRAGDLFHIAPGHDSWVVGEQPYISLHFLGAGDYAVHQPR